MKLRRLIVHRFRQVAPGTELDLDAPVVAVLGRNGAGKTTLLELLALVVSMDFSPLKGEEFDVEFGIAVLAANGTTHTLTFRVKQLAVEVKQLDGRPPTTTWSYSLTADDGSWRLEIQSHGASILSFGGADHPVLAEPPFGVAFMFAPLAGLDLGAAPLSLRAAFEASFHLGLPRFDEELGAYWAFKGRKDTPATSWGRRAPAFESVMGPLHNDPTQLRLGSQWSFVQDTVTQDELIEAKGSSGLLVANVPVLHRVREMLGFDSAVMGLRLLESHSMPRADGNHVRISTWGEASVHLHSSTRSINDSFLSYGEKRLLAMLLWIESARGVVLIDELSNGFHYDWIESVLAGLGDRQAILATQSPLLLDFLEFETANDVKSGFVFCSKDNGVMVWRNPTQYESELVFRAIEVGIQQVSEVLRTRGLW